MTTRFTLVPVYGERFVGRKEILGEMIKEASDPRSNNGFCLHGRRRVGKTSILKELEYELSKKEEIVIAHMSLYELADLSLKTFTEQLSAAVLKSFREKNVLPLEYTIDILMKSPGEVVDSALSKIKLGVDISKELRYFLEFRKEKAENYTDAIKRAFDLGEKLAKASKIKFILILDEFPEILKVEDGKQIVKMLRTLHEEHQHTTMIIAGSEKRTLEAVALGSASPFYKQLIPRKVTPFSFDETCEFLKKYGVKLSEEETKRLYEVTGGVPFYLQFIGRSMKTPKKIEDAIEEFIGEEGSVFFSEELEKLSEKEKVITIAIAKGAKTPTEIAESSGEPVTSVSSFLVGLQEKDVVVKVEKARYELVDGLFLFWLKRQYA